jgi:hypothetical protein
MAKATVADSTAKKMANNETQIKKAGDSDSTEKKAIDSDTPAKKSVADETSKTVRKDDESASKKADTDSASTTSDKSDVKTVDQNKNSSVTLATNESRSDGEGISDTRIETVSNKEVSRSKTSLFFGFLAVGGIIVLSVGSYRAFTKRRASQEIIQADTPLLDTEEFY